MSWLTLLSALVSMIMVGAFNVTYDHRALVIEGKRRLLISGSIHYPRSTPDMWPGLISASKEGGLDVIETYVFWNLHEPKQGQYDFEERKDLVKFVKLIANAGLYVHLRIGPYVCAEWNYGGFPTWLHFLPGIEFRTDNEIFKREMQRFTSKIVDMMKQEKLFASQGGPIILSQIENEYGNIDLAYGPAAKSYVKWAASMATSFSTGVPWVMCQQSDAPDPVINTCNGFYCDQFTPNSPQKPKMWTENWTGWFLSFGGAVPRRLVQDIAFAVARFFQRGGAFQNYYMYHGGTNFGHTSGGPFIATSYDYDAPIDEYGIIRQPKWGHLRDLHKAIKLCEKAVLATDPAFSSLGPNLEAHVYEKGSACAAFLANIGTDKDVTVTFRGLTYHLPPWSVSILPDCRNVAFNTAKINSQTTNVRMRMLAWDHGKRLSLNSFQWSWIKEAVGVTNKNSFAKNALLEQINTTQDTTDYLWYSTSLNIKGDEPYLFNYNQTLLVVVSLGHGVHAFINKIHAGSGVGNSRNAKVALEIGITLVKGQNTIDLLSETVGLQNYGAFFDKLGAGITGPVSFKGNNMSFDLSANKWTYQVGLKGEELGLYEGSSSEWISGPALLKNESLVWYKAVFDAPEKGSPIALNLTGMGKGEAWINGQSIGRYWPAYISRHMNCVGHCDYRGSYNSSKCLHGCGKPSQELYHVPLSWLQPTGNMLVLFEEMGGDPGQIFFARREVIGVCAHVLESHISPVDAWSSKLQTGKRPAPILHLECPSLKLISSIKFASFGTPTGTCGSFQHGSCNSSNTGDLVHQACTGQRNCDIHVSFDTFGDPCVGVTKGLAVEAECA